ncbi:MAG: serine/threonine protein kinase [Syntrophobacteraceae bacterium]|jgi:CheY-like chemotaxis protein|nr:serine/threonine protein kinase [Syntrophobacteraceae bacterium]
MPTPSVLLIRLQDDEVLQIKELLQQCEPEVKTWIVQSIQEAEEILARGNLLLIVVRVDEHRKRPDQDLKRIRRLVKFRTPVLLLVTVDCAIKVKEAMRAGADEYWILPMDSLAFPSRFYVLLEWGQSILAQEWSGRRDGSLWLAIAQGIKGRARGFLQRLAGMLGRRPEATADISELVGGKWGKLNRLGFGSYGEVWLVKEPESSDLAVAKIPHSPKMNTRFLREAAILRRLGDHPNSVHLKEVVKQDGKVILIQEYVEGSTLQDLLGQGMDPAAKESAFLQLLEIVARAHSDKIMHRDIKPENIIVTRQGILKLLDFGTGKDLTRRSISNTIIGSRPFMAPEQIMGNSRLASDVWALGVILYAFSTGCLPFYDENEKTLMDIILESEPERPRNLEPGLSEALELVILRCLEKDWNRRYRNAVELKEDLLERLPLMGRGEILTGA